MGCQLTKHLLDAEKLVNLRFTGEQGVAVCYLPHDASNGPDIHLLTVHITQEQLWCSVPSRRNVVAELGTWLVDLPCESKIADLQFIVPKHSSDVV